MPSRQRTSTPRKNKRVLLRQESIHTLGMHYNKKEKATTRGEMKEIRY
jgi:hypothetical protein